VRELRLHVVEDTPQLRLGQPAGEEKDVLGHERAARRGMGQNCNRRFPLPGEGDGVAMAGGRKPFRPI
jgi:hypothetical protein